MEVSGGTPRLGPVAELELRPVFQPIVDLRDGAVVGYEAFVRSGPHGAPEILAAARREKSLPALDGAARAAAVAAAHDAGLGAPLCLFLNADAASLEAPMPLPATSLTLLVDIHEEALIERPDAVLRGLTELRRRGWGIALDDFGGDSRALALLPLLYPDVIKLDLRLLARRSREEAARIVTAVGAEAERRHASVLAEGIDSEQQLELARSLGATLGQGYHLGEPGPLPEVAAVPGRALKLPGGAGDPFGATPWQRVTNWRRTTVGSRQAAGRAVEPLIQHAAELGRTALLLGLLAHPRYAEQAVRRFDWIPERIAFVGVLNAGDAFAGTGVRSGSLADDDPLQGGAVVVALSPDFAACYVSKQRADDRWEWALTYDRETVVECALPLMARMEPLAR